MNILKINKAYFVIILMVAMGIIGYNYLYKKHRDIASENAAFTISSKDLLKEFSSNSTTSTNKYLDKTIEIYGHVTGIENLTLTIDDNVICYFDDSLNEEVILNEKVRIKGRCIGFDDLLESVKMDQCVVLKID